jgi:hypothetical protein
METYAFLDPASGKVKVDKLRAQSAITVIHPDAVGRIFVLEAWADRIPTVQLIEKVYELNERYRPVIFGCEANAMQSLFVDLFQEHARLTQRSLPLVPITQNTKIDKDFRIRHTIQPILNQHRLFLRTQNGQLQTGTEALRSQLASAPGGVLKDLIDALASTIALAPARTQPQAQSGERDLLIARLRKQGIPNDRLRDRLAEFDRHAIMEADRTATLNV